MNNNNKKRPPDQDAADFLNQQIARLSRHLGSLFPRGSASPKSIDLDVEWPCSKDDLDSWIVSDRRMIGTVREEIRKITNAYQQGCTACKEIDAFVNPAVNGCTNRNGCIVHGLEVDEVSSEAVEYISQCVLRFFGNYKIDSHDVKQLKVALGATGSKLRHYRAGKEVFYYGSGIEFEGFEQAMKKASDEFR